MVSRGAANQDQRPRIDGDTEFDLEELEDAVQVEPAEASQDQTTTNLRRQISTLQSQINDLSTGSTEQSSGGGVGMAALLAVVGAIVGLIAIVGGDD